MARGGSRPGAGRKVGAVNKITADVKAIAAEYGASAVSALAEIATDKTQPAAARVSAANALLDRGFGKPAQAVQLSGPDGGPIEYAQTIADEAARFASRFVHGAPSAGEGTASS